MNITEKNGIRIITLETDHLDALNSDELTRKLKSHSDAAEKVVVNLKNVTFIDSSGLGALLTVYRHISGNEGLMVIAEARETVKVLFKLVRLSHMIQVFDDLSDAVNHLQ